MSDVRVRFAPSPTGQIHIGNIRTALFNYLFAKENDGTFILRIEDTDQERSTSEFEEVIHKEMEWLGLDWDEGANVGGDFGPYRQMERLDIYEEYIEELLNKDLAYRCYCTPEELDQMREEQKANGQPPRYDGRCRNLTEEERQELEAEGREPVIRFQSPVKEREVVVNDLVYGNVSFSSDVIDDFVIVKSDGIPTYNFAVVVDDHLMEISHVIRGEDHLSNTPKQQLLYDAFDWEAPNFAHLPMILGSDRSKLSKRSGEAYVYVSEYRKKGYLPEALVNFLSLLGWSPKDEEEILSKEEIIDRFSIDGVNESAAVFDVEKLNWMNGVYIRDTELDKIVDLALPYLEAEYDLSDKSKEWIKLLVSTAQESLDYIAQITDEVEVFFSELEYEDKEEAIELFQEEDVDLVLKTLKEESKKLNSFKQQEVRDMMNRVRKELPVGGRLFFHPTRIALSGKTSGPALYDVATLLGKEETIKRLERALSLI
ncbi:glutamyl-tRNA synthetase [Halobacteroides halobius DSM 5150]|uniref:Glutamate--tRNA ligase n=1 Tax=Halobacteroides halobius (strain ATCC 35273 / DSM 5150 / MD-1) TaxID=748449 RepID=L0K584_HALHC|nr:glutamate--tRNA ligase [Halobacteroides halobius]AGB40176.1 glutamyl-tRNA synthetase [Halobacteroides halobius DSM 5150]